MLYVYLQNKAKHSQDIKYAAGTTRIYVYQNAELANLKGYIFLKVPCIHRVLGFPSDE